MVDKKEGSVIINHMVEYDKQQLDLIFHAMADATRRALLQRIIEKPHTVLKLAEPFEMSLNAISKHLKVLEKAGLVKRHKQGREYTFTFNPQALRPVDALLHQLKHYWEERLDSLEEFLNQKKENEK